MTHPPNIVIGTLHWLGIWPGFYFKRVRNWFCINKRAIQASTWSRNAITIVIIANRIQMSPALGHHPGKMVALAQQWPKVAPCSSLSNVVFCSQFSSRPFTFHQSVSWTRSCRLLACFPILEAGKVMDLVTKESTNTLCK